VAGAEELTPEQLLEQKRAELNELFIATTVQDVVEQALVQATFGADVAEGSCMKRAAVRSIPSWFSRDYALRDGQHH
jgi:hypothetical protein